MRDVQMELMAAKLRRLADDFNRVQEADFLTRLDPPTRVDNWFVSPYPGFQLMGEVVGHPRLPDGPFESSELYYINEERRLARTLSRWFRLGTPLVVARPQL